MRLWWALPLMLLCGAESAMADNQSQVSLGWLKTIAFAAHQTNYSGTFIYQHGSQVETSRITHVVDKDGEHERLESMDGPHREIIRNNDQVFCSIDGHKPVLLGYRHKDRSFPALLPEQLNALKANYAILAGPSGRVAGFSAQTILFQPKDRLRYAHKLWAHTGSGLLLKAAVLNARHHVVEQYAFTELNIGGNIKADWTVPDKAETVAMANKLHLSRLPEAGERITSSGWQVDALPRGFKKIMEIRRPMHGRKAPVLHMVFSDGLAGISVFIEDESGDSDDDDNLGLSSQGAIQIYRKAVGDHLVTVVGEVPPRTVMQVADSVRYAGK
jgi:sigma-E factor negative regulatory protein RseB